jgi:hypothetical protein
LAQTYPLVMDSGFRQNDGDVVGIDNENLPAPHGRVMLTPFSSPG